MKFVAEFRHWWKYWSVRLAILAGIVAGAMTAFPQVFLGLVAYVPVEYRPVASVFVAILVAGVPTLVRMIPQAKLGDDA